jgi:hypothetical protein
MVNNAFASLFKYDIVSEKDDCDGGETFAVAKISGPGIYVEFTVSDNSINELDKKGSVLLDETKNYMRLDKVGENEYVIRLGDHCINCLSIDSSIIDRLRNYKFE